MIVVATELVAAKRRSGIKDARGCSKSHFKGGLEFWGGTKIQFWRQIYDFSHLLYEVYEHAMCIARHQSVAGESPSMLIEQITRISGL